MRGKFIVVEGGEGAGKSSALSWLKEKLSEGFLFTREPGGSPNAEAIRELVLAPREEDLDTLTQLLLFEAARREHVLTTILPALESGTTVICDRFSAGTYAYQVVAGKRPDLKDFFNAVDALVRGEAIPDHTIFLDLEPAVGIARKKDSNEALNVFDQKALVFHEEVRRGLKEYISDKPHTVIDASKSREEVREALKEVIMTCVQ